jgi:hypothetical protein
MALNLNSKIPNINTRCSQDNLNMNMNNLNDDIISQRSKQISHISRSTKFQPKNKSVSGKSFTESVESNAFSYQTNRNKNLERLNFSGEGDDEWNKIVKYNQKLYQEENLNNKLKDIEIKKRIREDLDNQIRQKLKRNKDEFVKEKEYDEIILNHCNFMENLEKQRQIETRDRLAKEKENRDKQLFDEQKRKKMEILKEKKYDREYVKNILSEIEKDKQIQMKRRIDERELMFNTIRENKLNKQRQMENKERERLNDIKSTEEYAKVLDRQEQERNEYFKKIERNANNFINKMAENVINEMEYKNKEEEQKMKTYLEEKEAR